MPKATETERFEKILKELEKGAMPSIDLQNMELNTKDIEKLIDTLIRNPSALKALTSLNLKNNSINAKGLKHVARLLEHPDCILETLNLLQNFTLELQSNDEDIEGLTILDKALKKNSSLKNLQPTPKGMRNYFDSNSKYSEILAQKKRDAIMNELMDEYVAGVATRDHDLLSAKERGIAPQTYQLLDSIQIVLDKNRGLSRSEDTKALHEQTRTDTGISDSGAASNGNAFSEQEVGFSNLTERMRQTQVCDALSSSASSSPSSSPSSSLLLPSGGPSASNSSYPGSAVTASVSSKIKQAKK